MIAISWYLHSFSQQSPPQRKSTVITNIMCLLLETMREMMKKKASIGSSSLSSGILELVKGFISDPSVELRRVAGEVIGMLCRTEGDQFTLDLAKSLVGVVCILFFQN